MSRNLKMPWSIEDTIENMEHIRDIMIRKVRGINLDGKSEQDVAEVNFDFSRAVKALEKQIPYPLKAQDGDTGICKCGIATEIIDEPFYCKYCGQRLCKQLN